MSKSASMCSTGRSDLVKSMFKDGSKEFSTRIQNSVERFKNRLNNKRYQRQIRGFILASQKPRPSIVGKNQPSSQRIFNHYQITKPDLLHTSDFRKQISRKSLIDLIEQNSQYEPNIQKLHQKYFYKPKPFKCLIDMGKQSKSMSVSYQSVQSPDIECIRNGQIYLGQNKITPIPSFWNNSGKQLPPGNQLKKLNPLTDHWRLNGRFQRGHQLMMQLLQKGVDNHKKKKRQLWLNKQFQKNKCSQKKKFNYEL